MATLVDFVTELLGSVVELVVIFLFDVAPQDPLTFLLWAFGAGITTASVGFGAFLAAGAVASALRSAVS